MTAAIYLDLDGTLLDPGGRVVPATLDAIALARSRGWRPVLLTGRSHWVAVALARALAIDDVICELGAVLRVDGRTALAAPESVPFPRAALLRALADEPVQEHEPGVPRTAGLVLRSAVSAEHLSRRLADAGLTEWHAVDNGPSHRPTDLGRSARVVHVLPSGVDKATGVRIHQQLRDVAPERAAVVGDSPADLACAPTVAAMMLVRSGDESALAEARALGVAITAEPGARGALAAVDAITSAFAVPRPPDADPLPPAGLAPVV